MDEFDFEVVPLKRPEAEKEEGPGPASSPAPSRASSRAPFMPRLSSRTRLLRAGGILAVLLLAVSVVVAVTPGTRSAVVGFVLGPTSTATFTPPPLLRGYDHIAVEDQVPWGTLLIDGKPAPALNPGGPESQTGVLALPTFGLSRGMHQLEYRAAPFPVMRCILSVPVAPHDTCPLDPQAIDFLVSTGPGTRLVDLQRTVDRLPAAQLAALNAATQHALDAEAAKARGTLAPGDHYLSANEQVVAAGAPLTATPTYVLGPATSDPSGAAGTASGTGTGAPCVTLCAAGGPMAQSSATDWVLGAQMDVTWRYQTADGHVVLANGPPGPAGARQDVLIQVGARWLGRTDTGTGSATGEATGASGQWQARLLPTTAGVRDPVVCTVGAHYLDVLRAIPGQSTIDFSDESYVWPDQLWSSPSAPGCVFAGSRTDNQGNLTGNVALVLYRFGALLAVNPEAQQVFPHLPLASQHERALALAAWPPPTSTPTTGG